MTIKCSLFKIQQGQWHPNFAQKKLAQNNFHNIKDENPPIPGPFRDNCNIVIKTKLMTFKRIYFLENLDQSDCLQKMGHISLQWNVA